VCPFVVPEFTRTFVFEIGLAGDGLVQAAHEPADAGKPCPPDIDDVGDGCTFNGFEILAATVVLNQEGTFE